MWHRAQMTPHEHEKLNAVGQPGVFEVERSDGELPERSCSGEAPKRLVVMANASGLRADFELANAPTLDPKPSGGNLVSPALVSKQTVKGVQVRVCWRIVLICDLQRLESPRFLLVSETSSPSRLCLFTSHRLPSFGCGIARR